MKKLQILALVVVISIFLFIGWLSLNNEQILSLDYSRWYITTDKIGDLTSGYVYLSLKGSTTGDKVTVKTYGYGVIGEIELDLDQDKRFSQIIVIKSTHKADNIPRKYNTVLTAYKGKNTTSINLESYELTYLK
jgi:hypothetical protein